MQTSFSAVRVFTGYEWLEDHTITVEEGYVTDLIPSAEEGGNVRYPMIVPAFIDLQVYGAEGRLLAAHPQWQTLKIMQQAFYREGTQWFLPTVATNTTEVFLACVKAVRDYWEMDGKGVLGLHLEGPWIHPGKRGAHVLEWVHQPTVEEVSSLIDQTAGVLKMVTLAPETCSADILSLLKTAGIVISAGHSAASYTQALEGFECGITAVTHLYNAMSPLHHREPGLVGAALDHGSVKASIIPDGHHVDFAAVRIAKQAMGDRLFAITDAVTDTETGPYRHKKVGDKYECDGTLSGSSLSMHKAFLNLVQRGGIEPDEALRMCSLYPARVIRSKAVTGNIQPGHPAAFIALDEDLNFLSLLTSPGE